MIKVRKKKYPRYDLPQSNQLEISLFGPGFGECLAIHYGDGKWLTVDSCLEPDGETPAALAYLGMLGLDPSTCVTHNVVTHFDGDHIGGIVKLYSACSSARLILPAILDHRSMNTFIHYYASEDPNPLTKTTKVILDLLTYQDEHRNNDEVYVKEDSLIAAANGVRIWALAPSNKNMQRFWASLSARKPQEKSDRRGAGRLRPNDVSVACLLERDGFSALFGADLEENPSKGWTTVIDSSVAYNEYCRSAAVFKVPHHGSAGADCPAVWDAMERPFAILTPFKLAAFIQPLP